MDHKAGNQLPHGWMMGFSTVQVELFYGSNDYETSVGLLTPYKLVDEKNLHMK